MKSKLRIIISGIFYPFSMMSFFIKAFQRRDDVELFLVGAYTGDWIPWSGGLRLPQKYIIIPDLPLPQVTIANHIPYSMVENQIPWQPNLWLQIDAGFHFTTRPKANVVAHIQTDPHVLKPTYKLPKSYSDVNFSMQLHYMENGEFYLPYAYDPTIHYPMNLKKEYDACLIGLHYDKRTALVEAIRNKGFKVYYSIGEIYDQYREQYNKSKVALSWSSLEDVPARVFEAMGMKIALVANRVPDMANFFVDGEHYLGFDTVEEGVEQTLKLLRNEELRKDIACAGHEKAKAAHQWDFRANQILETCKLK